MSVVQKAPSNKRTILLLLILCIIAGIGVWIFFFRDSGSVSTGDDAAAASTKAAGLNPAIHKELFDDPRFRLLKAYAPLPVDIGRTGRDNPFAPVGAR